jgi:hypothetical protein
MLRASLILGLFAVSVASAAPPEWTLPPLPPDWKDVTEEMLKEPAIEAQKQSINKAGGTFALSVYTSEDRTGMMMVMTSVFDEASAVMAEANAFMDGARKRAARDAREISWNLDRTPTALVATQRLETETPGMPATTKTFVGYRDNDDLRAIVFLCFGGDEICGPLMAKVSVETAGMQLLADLDANKKKLTPARIGWIVGAIATLIFVLAALWKRRPRAPA